MQRRRSAGNFIRMDVGLDKECGLIGVRTGGEAGDGCQPNVAPFERFADRGQLKPIGMFTCPRFKDRREFVVLEEFVEADGRHGCSPQKGWLDCTPAAAGRAKNPICVF